MKFAFIHKTSGVVYLGSSPTVEHIPANGIEVRRDEYPSLFVKFGTKYGKGNGRTTFNLPRIVVGG